MKSLFDAMIVDLMPVNGVLRDHYNRALKKVIGTETSLTDFHIDMRGESPEIEKIIGEHYLQNGLASRYMIIVSPNQGKLDLLHQEFSFDITMMSQVFSKFPSVID